ncbi:MAG: hypothetical protein GX136_06360 [Clostridiales bacterium]|jgi:hypothetical protein|nr:hypothetical protein [Clostridiales bacterium]
MGFSFDTNTNNPADTMENEGAARENLAAYFLSAPPLLQQSEQEKIRYKRALRCMAELEIRSCLQSASIKRPLKYGDVNLLLTSVLDASAIILSKRGVELTYKTPEKSIFTAAEPRFLTTALIHLLHDFEMSNREGELYANIRLHKSSISVSVSGLYPAKGPKTLALVRAAARLHKGCAAVMEGTVAFSLHYGLTGAVGLFASPTVDELLKNPLSSVNVGLA